MHPFLCTGLGENNEINQLSAINSIWFDVDVSHVVFYERHFKDPVQAIMLCGRLFLFWNPAIVKWHTLIGQLFLSGISQTRHRQEICAVFLPWSIGVHANLWIESPDILIERTRNGSRWVIWTRITSGSKCLRVSRWWGRRRKAFVLKLVVILERTTSTFQWKPLEKQHTDSWFFGGLESLAAESGRLFHPALFCLYVGYIPPQMASIWDLGKDKIFQVPVSH